jgi:hypothetical protein
VLDPPLDAGAPDTADPEVSPDVPDLVETEALLARELGAELLEERGPGSVA